MQTNSGIHITGYKGRLGYALTSLFGCTPMAVDVTKQEEIDSWLLQYRPDVIINCAAKSSVDYSETHYAEAADVNFGGINRIVKSIIRNFDYSDYMPKLIHLSTDYVFPGTSGPYRDNQSPKLDRTNLSNYGFAKLTSELVLSVAYDNWIIARVTGLFGSYNGSSDLVSAVLDTIITGAPMYLTNELLGNPTYVPELASLLIDAANDEKVTNSFVHIAPRLVISRYEFVNQWVLPAFGLEQYSSLFIPCKTSDLGWLAKRPTKGGLYPTKNYEITRSLVDCLEEYGKYLGVS